MIFLGSCILLTVLVVYAWGVFEDIAKKIPKTDPLADIYDAIADGDETDRSYWSKTAEGFRR